MYKAKLILREHGYFKSTEEDNTVILFPAAVIWKKSAHYFIPLSLKKTWLISPWFADRTPTASGQRFRFLSQNSIVFLITFIQQTSLLKRLFYVTQKRGQDIKRSIHLALVHSKGQLTFKKDNASLFLSKQFVCLWVSWIRISLISRDAPIRVFGTDHQSRSWGNSIGWLWYRTADKLITWYRLGSSIDTGQWIIYNMCLF